MAFVCVVDLGVDSEFFKQEYAADAEEVYDVVGPVCESSDCFGRDERLPLTQRGDLLALRSAGAYGEVMASAYNCRHLPGSLFSDSF